MTHVKVNLVVTAKLTLTCTVLCILIIMNVVPQMFLIAENIIVTEGFLYTFNFLPAFCFCLLVLFHSSCCHVQFLWTTLLHKFHIFYSHTEWYLLFLQNVIAILYVDISSVKN